MEVLRLYIVSSFLLTLGSALNDKFLLRSSAEQLQHVPQNGRVVVLFRGQAFRVPWGEKPHPFCVNEAMDSQMNWTRSFLSNVAEPLEANGNKVDIVFTSPPCEMNKALADLLGWNRIRRTSYFSEENQGDSMRKAMGELKYNLDVQNYDLVIITRHDLIWKVPITSWAVSFNDFLFVAHCEIGAQPDKGGMDCVFDHVQVMPGKYFNMFYDVVVSPGPCFRTIDGHQCSLPMKEQLAKVGGKVSLIKGNWRPEHNVKDPTGICDFNR